MSRALRARRISAALLCGLLCLLAPTAVTAGGATDRLPDLTMGNLSEFRVSHEPTPGNPDRELLRFTAIIANKGTGPLIVRGSRTPGDDVMETEQVIKRIDAPARVIPSEGVARFDVGDGHNHWHVMDVETYELIPLGVPPEEAIDRVVGSKVGFCFFDTDARNLSRPWSPDHPIFHESGCGVSSSTSIRVGLSVGWGDRYSWFLARQWIRLASVPHGRYLVCATANAFGQWVETDSANNQAWAEIELYKASSSTAVRLLSSGRSSCEDRASLPSGGAWRLAFPRAEAIIYRPLAALYCRIEQR